MYICINHENAKINQTLNDFARTRVQLLGCRWFSNCFFFQVWLAFSRKVEECDCYKTRTQDLYGLEFRGGGLPRH